MPMQCPEVRLNIISSLESVNKGIETESSATCTMYIVLLHVSMIVMYMYSYIGILNFTSDGQYSVCTVQQVIMSLHFLSSIQ